MAKLPISNLPGIFTEVDKNIYDLYKNDTFIWEKSGNLYYITMVKWRKNKTIHTKLHHLVIGKPPKGKMVDHILGNRLDNRLKNLRFVTNAENMRNRNSLNSNNNSGYRGIYWDKQRNKWRAQIMMSYKFINLGRFEKLEDAIKARKEASIKYFGEYRGTV